MSKPSSLVNNGRIRSMPANDAFRNNTTFWDNMAKKKQELLEKEKQDATKTETKS